MYSDDFTNESRHMQALELGYQMDQKDYARYNSKDSGRSPDLDLPNKATNSSDVSLLSEFRPGSRGKFDDCSLLPTLSTQLIDLFWYLDLAVFSHIQLQHCQLCRLSKEVVAEKSGFYVN